jgi:tetratricopeptide (TPR) repeat protein
MVVVAVVLIAVSVSINLFTSAVAPSNESIASRFVSNERITDSNNFRKLMTTLSFEMFKANPVIGAGADNFGMEVNKYREIYGTNNPDDINLKASENELPERSHNEYLQILAELGVVGFLIFLMFLLGIALMLINAFRRRASLLTLGSHIGVFMFLASSLVSSYSFRFVQNALIFFIVLAVASKQLLRQKPDKPLFIPATRLKFAGAFAVVLCLSLAGYSFIRVASAYYATSGNYIQSTDEAMPLYQRAIWLDNENAFAHYDLASRLLDDGRYADAVPHYERAVKLGIATSPNLSYFSTVQLLAGDTAGAEATFAYGAKLYPQSVFVITRYAFLLKQNGKPQDAATQLERARMLDQPAAETWWTFMNDGPEQATDNFEQNATLTEIMDLKPYRSIYAIKKERDIRFPGEKFEFPTNP